jgi:RHS repeat-associated protein
MSPETRPAIPIAACSSTTARINKVKVLDAQQATIGEYFYDGDGKRIKKYVPNTGETTVFVYDAAGKQIAEYSSIVAATNDAKVAYLTDDHLGSPRINSDGNGAVTARHDYHPFGEEIATSQRVTGLGYTADTIRKQFTGYERDSETELDFAQARYHDFSVGRYSTPDPFMASARQATPQTFNRYSYVVNNHCASLIRLGWWAATQPRRFVRCRVKLKTRVKSVLQDASLSILEP